MSGDQSVQMLWAFGAIVLVLSGLIARRLAIGLTLRMLAAWIVIFAVVLIGVSYRGEMKAIWQRVTGDLAGAQVEGGMLRIAISGDGHFWARGSVNGHMVRFLIDSGATTTALSTASASAAGLRVEEAGFPVVLETANGQVQARRATIDRLVIGPIEAKDLAAVVSPQFGDINVLGMNFLSSLKSWRVEGDTLVLEPRKSATT